MALPMTPKQLSVKTGIPLHICSYTLAKFFAKNLAICFNPDARNNRVYMLSELGKEFHFFFGSNSSPSQNSCDIPDVDWELYGWLCYSHRSAIIKVLDRQMRSSEIKRTLRLYRPDVKISANNVRDVMKLLLAKNIVQKILGKNKKHPQYDLTMQGQLLRKVLLAVELK